MKSIKYGWLSGFGMMIAGVGLVLTAIAAVGVLLGFQLSFEDVALPDDWAGVGLMAGGLLLIAALSTYGAFVTTKFKAAKGKPGVRVALVVVGLGLLVLAFRATQIILLTNTYGSMLAYYATDGDLDDVKAELADKPKQEHLDEGISRAAGYGNVGALKLLLAAGGTFADTGSPEEFRSCALNRERVRLEFIQVALAAGANAKTCPKSEHTIYEKVRFGQASDAEMAQIVTALRGAGWPANTKPERSKQTPLQAAEKRKMPLTAAALR
ncbi:MAG: hypothetical protein ACI9U2_003817 [Bradymonadia bacterium]|jgi:hypothetical protein